MNPRGAPNMGIPVLTSTWMAQGHLSTLLGPTCSSATLGSGVPNPFTSAWSAQRSEREGWKARRRASWEIASLARTAGRRWAATEPYRLPRCERCAPQLCHPFHRRYLSQSPGVTSPGCCQASCLTGPLSRGCHIDMRVIDAHPPAPLLSWPPRRRRETLQGAPPCRPSPGTGGGLRVFVPRRVVRVVRSFTYVYLLPEVYERPRTPRVATSHRVNVHRTTEC